MLKFYQTIKIIASKLIIIKIYLTFRVLNNKDVKQPLKQDKMKNSNKKSWNNPELVKYSRDEVLKDIGSGSGHASS